MRVFIEGLKLVLDYLLPHTAEQMRKSLLELLPVLIIKKEAGYEQECAAFLDALVDRMKDYLRASEDVVDFLSSMSQGVIDNMHCSNLTIFKEKLKAHKISLKRPRYVNLSHLYNFKSNSIIKNLFYCFSSHETLLNIRNFFTCNKDHIRQLYCDLDSKSFSEDCETSTIHQIIQLLCNILKSRYDDKVNLIFFVCDRHYSTRIA